MASYAAIKTNALEEYLMTWKDTSGIYSLVLKRYKIINVSDSVLFILSFFFFSDSVLKGR